MKAPNRPAHTALYTNPTRDTLNPLSNQPEANQGLKTMELEMGSSIFGSQLGQTVRELWSAFSARLEHVWAFLELLARPTHSLFPQLDLACAGAWSQSLAGPVRPRGPVARASSEEHPLSRMTWAASQASVPGNAPQPPYKPVASPARAPQSTGAAQKGTQSAPKAPKLVEPVSSEAWLIVRDIAYASKVISLSLAGLFVAGSLVWIFAFGQPDKLVNIPLGIYQGFNCGWTVAIKDPWTCDK